MKSFCSASWSDININLQNRFIKYCCHSQRILFPETLTVDWILNNQYITQRKSDMLCNKFNTQCKICYKAEIEQSTSYRLLLNNAELQEQIIKEPEKNYISKIEITFDNICNQSCLYCSAAYSSKIAEEQGLINKFRSANEDDLKVIVNWLETLPANNEIIIRIMGGEPTASKKFFSFLDKLISGKAKNKKFIIHTVTNGNTSKTILNKFDYYFKNSPNWKWSFGISNESSGKVAENIRYGLDYDKWLNNLEYFAANKNIYWVNIVMAINLFSVKTMPDVFLDIDNIFKKYNSNYGYAYNWVTEPDLMYPKYLSSSFKSYIIQTKNLANKSKSKLEKQSFIKYLNEIEKIIGTKEIDLEKIEKWLLIKNQEKKGKLDIQLLLDQIK